MNAPLKPDPGLEGQRTTPLLDVLIRAGLIFALATLCYRIFSPFLTLTVWAVILAVTMYPLHQWLAYRLGGRQGWASTLIVLVGVALFVVPTGLLVGSLGDAAQEFVQGVQANTLQIPAPRPGVEGWPIVGKDIHAFWSKAHSDLPALVQSMQPKIGELALWMLGAVAGIGGGMLQLLAAFVIAGVIMAFGEAGARSSEAIFARIISPERAPQVRRAVHGDHSCGRTGCHRRGPDPGPRGRRDTARGRNPAGGPARDHRPGAGHCTAARRARPLAGDCSTSG